MNTDNDYNPVRLNPAEEVAEKRASNPEFKIAYDALEDEFASLPGMRESIQEGLKEDVAECSQELDW